MTVKIINGIYLLSRFWLLMVLPFMSGCSIKPVALDRDQLERRIALDLQAMFAGSSTPRDALTLEQAMARAVSHNLQQRVVALEGALALGLNELASYEMLPRVQASAGYVQRDRTTYVSQDRFQTTNSLEAAWGVLDFGVSYLDARQKSDGVLVARQQRRKAALDLMAEVESAFGQALVAQRMEKSVRPLAARISKALENAREVERQGIKPPQESLDFQKRLLKILDQLQRLQRQVSGSKLRLAELMNLEGGDALPQLEESGFWLPLDLKALPDMAEMEEFALKNRPELLERHYQSRIQADESRKALLRLLPGLDVSVSRRYDNGSVYVNRSWVENGVSLAWNLIKAVTAPELLAQSQLEGVLEERRRLALSMTVLTQLRVAHLGLMEAKMSYETALELSKVDRRLFEHAVAGRDVATLSEAQLIESEADLLLQDARRDLAYSEIVSAASRLLNSLGLNRLPFGFETMDDEQLTQALEEMSRRPQWASHTLFEADNAKKMPEEGRGNKEKGVASAQEALQPVIGEEDLTPAPPKSKGDSGGNSRPGDAPYEPQWILESQAAPDKTKESGQGERPYEPIWILETPDASRMHKVPVWPLDATVATVFSAEGDGRVGEGRGTMDADTEDNVGVILKVGTFAVRERALEVYSRLADKEFPVVVTLVTNAQGDDLYQVTVGPVRGMKRGREMHTALQTREGLTSMVVLLPIQAPDSNKVVRQSDGFRSDTLAGLEQVIPLAPAALSLEGLRNDSRVSGTGLNGL
ncbi:MAG: TolC family protein [Magnetococcales bacterium]|nr:TolC family protein [Magnetococcales bacterium]